jgi:hypothetical protein
MLDKWAKGYRLRSTWDMAWGLTHGQRRPSATRCSARWIEADSP